MTSNQQSDDPSGMRLGVCYYPEHWPEELWADDARRMVEVGLSRVRIGEFAWSRLEPEPGRFAWAWLDRAIQVLADAGLGVILGTPTATPPKWLVDRMPDMIAIGADGQPRRFGSRRHYCFSHEGYRLEAKRIAQAVAERYGSNPAVVAWQVDNEYGCHDTTLSFSPAAAAGFRRWLAQRYGMVANLNLAWGNVFWSMEYRSFEEVDLPNETVTEANPSHLLDFYRYSSEQVTDFNDAQVQIIKRLSPGKDITHNFMGFYTGFDHRAVAQQLDVVGWDSYPLGFLETFLFSEAEKLEYARQGHPDVAAFHHDLYRGCGANERLWILEQQPGPVNWAKHNPAPIAGMVRFWTLEAMAHGAELVSYFRWRQYPFAQEQMHAGLLRPDNVEAPGLAEVREAAVDISELGDAGAPIRQVAIVFDYESEWVTDIQPQGADFSALWATFACYSALRKLGLNIDIVGPDANLEDYSLVVVPCQPIVDRKFAKRLGEFAGTIIIGPRSGSKTAHFSIPAELPPGPLQAIIPAAVLRVESLRPGLIHSGNGFEVSRWSEHIAGRLEGEFITDDGIAAVWKSGRVRYLGTWPEPGIAKQIFTRAAREVGLQVLDLPESVRVRRTRRFCFVFNHGNPTVSLPADFGEDPLVGSRTLGAAGVAIFA